MVPEPSCSYLSVKGNGKNLTIFVVVALEMIRGAVLGDLVGGVISIF